jgi:hypothetical protein
MAGLEQPIFEHVVDAVRTRDQDVRHHVSKQAASQLTFVAGKSRP